MGFFENAKLKKQGLTKAVIKDESEITYDPSVHLLMANDAVNICAHACSACWDVKLPNGYADRSIYVGKRTKSGHSSVVEHSISTFYMEVADEDLPYLAEIFSYGSYLKSMYHHSKNRDVGYLLISGSWRAFNNLIRNSIMRNNPIINRLITNIYSFCDSCGFTDLIKDGFVDQSCFSDSNMDYNYVFKNLVSDNPISINEKIDIYGWDNMDELIHNFICSCPEPELFTPEELFPMASITILFKNMTRTATHQLVRHRNAITQESQRYVDYSDAAFGSPDTFKDIYDSDYKYSIQFAGSSKKFTLRELGEAMCKIYGQLISPEKTNNHALLKEDARAFLPSAVYCRKLFMTFTWDHLFAFLRLREDKHAQAEIRGFAIAIGDFFSEQFNGRYVPCYRKDNNNNDIWYKYHLSAHVWTEENTKTDGDDEKGIVDTAEEFEEIMDKFIFQGEADHPHD